MHELFRRAAALEDQAEAEAQLELGVLQRVRAVQQVLGTDPNCDPNCETRVQDAVVSLPKVSRVEEEAEEALCLEENDEAADSEAEDGLVLEENEVDGGDDSSGEEESVVLEANEEEAGEEAEDDLVLEENA